MKNFNFSLVEGNLVKSPDMRKVKGDYSICKFVVGTNQSFTDKKGKLVNQAHFFEIQAWNKLGEVCHKYLKKGSRVLISGVLKKNSWKNSDGQFQSKVFIEAKDINFLSPIRKEEVFA